MFAGPWGWGWWYRVFTRRDALRWPDGRCRTVRCWLAVYGAEACAAARRECTVRQACTQVHVLDVAAWRRTCMLVRTAMTCCNHAAVAVVGWIPPGAQVTSVASSCVLAVYTLKRMRRVLNCLCKLHGVDSSSAYGS